MNGPTGGKISDVEPLGVGDLVGLRSGDRLLAINGQPLRDVIDVQYYGAEEMLDLLVERDQRQIHFRGQREYGQELGISFTNPTFDVDIRRCANNCDFCFVRQNAHGMRRSLYVKDDDYRYSFLFGNFVTLTNFTEQDWARLVEQRLSPLYVSVHASELGLRRRFLRRKDAPDVIEQLLRLSSLGIQVHSQVVLVPGLNDGAHLARTLSDLMALCNEPVLSVGIVPIGLTRFHRGSCRTYTARESRQVLDQVENWRAEMRALSGSNFLYPSDEWYLIAGRDIPPAADYDGFPQLENGVGMVRRTLDEWARARASGSLPELKAATLVTGTLAAPVWADIVTELNGRLGAEWCLLPVKNDFFGNVTTVSGLLTAQDVVAALRDRTSGETVLLPRAMFAGRYGASPANPDVTLDGWTVDEISARLEAPVAIAGTLAEAVAALS